MKKNKIKKKIITCISLLSLCLFAGFFICCFIENGFQFKLDLNLLYNYKTYLIGLEIFGIILAIYLYYWNNNYWTRNTKNLVNGNESDKCVLSNLEQSHFQTEEEFNQNFISTEFSELSHLAIDGIPLRAELIKNNLKINISKPTHTLVIGTTGSGKTTTFINPTIQILAETQNKPSMLISDPKGELYSLHANALKQRGYDIKILDLRNPFNSVKWNPLEKPYEMYQRMLNLEKEVIEDEENGMFRFASQEFFTREELNSAIQVLKQKLCDEIYEDLHDIVSIICPIINKSEPMWESGSKNFILAIALAMLEDSENPNLGLTKEKFNFYNLMKIATNTEQDCEELKRYFEGRDKISSAVSLSKQVLDAGEKTRGSYLSNTFDKLAMFSDMSLCSLTSENELKFSDMADKPTALFLQIPDEKETRHTLASMVILQAYKELVAKANTYKDLSLPRSVYFLLDEFGNLPKIHKLEQMITVGRSRKIWLCLVVQSYAQLAKVYDEKSADIIKSNCNIQIFIGTSDLKTIEEFSKLCGNFSIVQRGVSFSTSKDDLNSSISVKERPLIYPSELAELNSAQNMGNAIIRVLGFPPIKSKFTPSFQCNKYNLGQAHQKQLAGRYFNERQVFYDISMRNRLIINNIDISTNFITPTQTKQIEDIRNVILNINNELCVDKEKEALLKMLDENKLNTLKTSLLQLSRRARTLEDEILETELNELVNEIEKLLNKRKND